MKILCIGPGSYGDVHPMIAVAQALKKRGHQVQLVAERPFGALISESGLDFIPFDAPTGEDFRSGSLPVAKVPGWISDSWIGRTFAQWNSRKRWIPAQAEQLYHLTEQQCRKQRDTVLVAVETAFGARIAREKLGTPLVSICLQPSYIRSSYDAPSLPVPDGTGPLFRMLRRCVWATTDVFLDRILTSQINRFRSKLELAPIDRPYDGWIHSPDLTVCLFPRWFNSPRPDWPSNVHCAEFPLFDEVGVREIPDELQRFLAEGEPPVVFTRGSHFRQAGRLFEVAIEVCRASGLRGVLLSPSSDSVPDSLPKTILYQPYVPFSAMLPRAAAIVHHGGIGTTALALAAGIPQIVVPFAGGQLDTAKRVQRLGAGLCMPFKRLRPKLVLRELERLLRSTEVMRTCRMLAGRIHQPVDLSEVCRLIEGVTERGTHRR